MAVTGSAGADRARWLLNGIPDRFNEFCHMDQFTFVQLADWIIENAESSTCEENISVEESLFVFLDIVAQGNSFRNAAYTWDHDIKLTQKYLSPRPICAKTPIADIEQHLPQRLERPSDTPGEGKPLPLVSVLHHNQIPMADTKVLAPRQDENGRPGQNR
jgi:hypothetical protein